MITLITPTGSRPEAFEMCKEFISNQSYTGEVQWIVIDDGEEPLKKFFIDHVKSRGDIYVEQYRGPKTWKPNINTQRLNLDASISKIKGGVVFVIEDDDYYSPNYLEAYMSLIPYYDVVGEANTKYYNLHHASYRAMENYEHSSLCQTAFVRSLLPLFEESVNSGELYIDIVFWEKVMRSRSIKKCLLTEANLSIGIKGLPGRQGIGIGHRPKAFISDDDINSTLKTWTGDDFKYYKKYLS